MTGFLGRIFSYALLLLNLVAICWLGLCFAASQISPARIPYLSLFSLTTPFAIITNFAFTVFWLFTRHKLRTLPSLLTLLALYKLVGSVFGLNFFEKNQTEAYPGAFKVMTWNVHGMGIYNRPADKSVPGRIIDLIDRENPDILCMQEFYTEWNNAMKPYSKEILEACGFRDFRFVYDNTLSEKIYLGTAIYSKFPISNLVETPVSENIKLTQCDITLPQGNTVRAFFIHLQSFLLMDKDKKLIEDLKRRDHKIPLDTSRSFALRFNKAYVRRAAQAETAASVIRSSPYPVIVCGDLNDLPGSYTYRVLKGDLSDAFSAKGKWLGRTYNAISPTLRIDHIFYSPDSLRITGFKTIRTGLSDHNPVIAVFEPVP